MTGKSLTFRIGLMAILAVLVFAKMAGLSTPLPVFSWAQNCTLTGVGGDLEPGDHPAVLPSVFTITCKVGGNPVTITKFFVNRQGITPAGTLQPGQAPNTDILSIEIRLVAGTQVYSGTAPAAVWPIPSTSFTPAFTGITVPAGKTLRVEIRPTIAPGPTNTIPPKPTGGKFCTSVLLEGSEAGNGGKTGFLNDPNCEDIEKDFKVVNLPAPTVTTIPQSNLNPSNTKRIHKFAVNLTINDDVTTPELNTTGISISNASITMTLTGTGNFVAGCVASVDLVNQATNSSLIGGPQNATKWAGGGTLPPFNIPANLLIPNSLPDGGNSSLTLNVDVVITLAPTPMPTGCHQSTIDASVAVQVKFDATENAKQTFNQTVTAADPVADTIFDSGFEAATFGAWSFEFLSNQQPLPIPTLGPSVIGEIQLTATDEDSSNNDPVEIKAVRVTNTATPACTAPGDIVNVQVRDTNGNILGASSGFGVIPLTSPVTVPDGNMGTPSAVTLEVVVTTADNPPPNPACQLQLQVQLLGIEGGNVFGGPPGRSLDPQQGLRAAAVTDVAWNQTQLGFTPATPPKLPPGGSVTIQIVPAGPAAPLIAVAGPVNLITTAFTPAQITLPVNLCGVQNITLQTINLFQAVPTQAAGTPPTFTVGVLPNANLDQLVQQAVQNKLNLPPGATCPGIANLTFRGLKPPQFGVTIGFAPAQPGLIVTDVFGRTIPVGNINLVAAVTILDDPSLEAPESPDPRKPTPQGATVTIDSLTLVQGSTGTVSISIDTDTVAEFRGTLVLDDPLAEVDTDAIFEVTEVLSGDPRRYQVRSSKITQVDIDKDGKSETVIDFEVALAPRAEPAGGAILQIRGKAKAPGALSVFFAGTPTLRNSAGELISVTVRSGSIRVQEGRQPD